MKIQINTDAHIHGREALATQVTETIEHCLQRFQNIITRVEVHLSDQNGDKSGQLDKRCVMEARLEGRQPIAATDEAPSMVQAVKGAVEKLSKLIDSQLGRASSNERSPVKPPFVNPSENGP
jgi:ribosome-associated translation inhibitor RaiA